MPLSRFSQVSQTRTSQAKLRINQTGRPWFVNLSLTWSSNPVWQLELTCAESFLTQWVGKLWLLQWDYGSTKWLSCNIEHFYWKRCVIFRFLNKKFLNLCCVRIWTHPTLIWPFRRILATCKCKDAGCFEAQEPNWHVTMLDMSLVPQMLVSVAVTTFLPIINREGYQNRQGDHLDQWRLSSSWSSTFYMNQ